MFGDISTSVKTTPSHKEDPANPYPYPGPILKCAGETNVSKPTHMVHP